MTGRTYQDAYTLARRLAQAGDRKGADALMARLLWHVRAEDGGFVGLSDKQLEAKVEADPRLNTEAVNAAMWNPGEWPVVSESGLSLAMVPERTPDEARAARSVA